MTKSEYNEVIKAVRYINAGMTDTAARALSALYRAARSTKSQNEILAFGMDNKLVTLPEWIV